MSNESSLYLSGGYLADDIVPTHKNVNDVSLWLRHEIAMISGMTKSSIDSSKSLRDYLSMSHVDQLHVRLEEWLGYELCPTVFLVFLSLNEAIQRVYQFICIASSASLPLVNYKNQTIMGHLAHG